MGGGGGGGGVGFVKSIWREPVEAGVKKQCWVMCSEGVCTTGHDSVVNRNGQEQ